MNEIDEVKRSYEGMIKDLAVRSLPTILSSQECISFIQETVRQSTMPMYPDETLKEMLERIGGDLQDFFAEKETEDLGDDTAGHSDELRRELPAPLTSWPQEATHAIPIGNPRKVAFGKFLPATGEMQVLKGSYFSEDWRPKSTQGAYYNAFQWVERSDQQHDILDLDEEGSQILRRDLMFKSASCAASVISGGSAPSRRWISRSGEEFGPSSTKTKSVYPCSNQQVRLTR